jgi:HAE1 family hydrophobic/amphiphilic exporter-1
MIAATLELPVGTDIKETSRVADNLMNIIKDLPDVLNYGYTAGISAVSEGDVATGQQSAAINKASIFVRLKEKNKRSMSAQEISDYMRNALPSDYGVKLTFQEMGMSMGSTSSFDIKLFGKELDKLSEIAQMISDRMKNIKGVKDVEISLRSGKPEMNILIDRTKASFLGVTSGEAASMVKLYTLGTFAGRYRERGDEMDIRVKLPEEER